jgi:hypothetical protein
LSKSGIITMTHVATGQPVSLHYSIIKGIQPDFRGEGSVVTTSNKEAQTIKVKEPSSELTAAWESAMQGDQP